MSIASKGLSAIGKLFLLVILLAAFGTGMAGVVYMSLSGNEIKVPEITGKDFLESEKELASLGLKIKKRADRASTEKMNTVLEQLPKPGETVKTGQMIYVVVSKAGLAVDDTPSTLQKNVDSDDSEKIEEMISDKPKKPKANANSNSNTKKKADTTRDVLADSNNSNSSSGDAKKPGDDGDRKDPVTTPGDKGNKNTSTPPKPQGTPVGGKPAAGKPAPDKKPRSDGKQ